MGDFGPDPVDELAASPAMRRVSDVKLHPPSWRASWVERPRLMEALGEAVRRPVTLVAAPAGYGKTTAVAQALHGVGFPASAWVSLDDGDNVSASLWAHVAAALERAGCVLPTAEPSQAYGSGGSGRFGRVLPPLLVAVVSALEAMGDDLVLVLDDFHCVQSTERHDEVEVLIQALPEKAHLVIITRSDPGLRLGRLRVSQALVELRADDLAFTPQEARELVAGTGVVLADDTVVELVGRTEGWPAALYLAALSLAGRPDADDFVHRFSGSNRFIGDYLTEEVLSRHPARLRDFILEVSVLDRFCAGLCDHVLGRSDSATVLKDLERANLFLVPLDDERTWFRFHQLYATVARSELELSRPDRVGELHARAAQWFSGAGLVPDAVTHWLAAGRKPEASELVHAHWLRFVDAGQLPTVQGWLDVLGPVDDTPPGDTAGYTPDHTPARVAAHVTAAWMAGVAGDETDMARHLHALEGADGYGPLPDGTRSVASAKALMRAWFGFGGPLNMLAAARAATGLETDGRSAQFAIAQAALGHAHYVQGRLEQAILPLRAATRADGAPGMIRIVALSLECFVESERGNTMHARECADRAIEVLDSRGLGAAPQVSWAYVALALAQADAGKSDDAMRTLELGLSTRQQGSTQAAWGPIHHLLVSARIAARLGHTALARELLADVTERMSRFADGMSAMLARADEVRKLIRDHDAVDVNGEPLTERELDVLRLMQSSLSLQEIAGELYLSANTVKTHARSVYRKLGAHSRTDAVLLARQRSLI